MKNDIILIFVGIVGGYLLTLLKDKITKSGIEQIKEKFDISKFTKGMLSVSDPTLWAKDISHLFNFRKLIIYGIIIISIYAYGVYKGQTGKPIILSLDYNKEITIKLDGQELYKPKNDNRLYVRDEKGKILKVITPKDIPELKKKLKPYDLIFEPVFVGGYGLGSPSKPELGVGSSFFRWFKNKVEAFLTNRGVYIGTSYSITDNSGIGAGVGKGYKGDNRVIIYWRWKF